MSLLFYNLTIGLCMKGSLAVEQGFRVFKSCSTSSLIFIFSICSLLTQSLQSLQLIQRYDISVAGFSTWWNMLCCFKKKQFVFDSYSDSSFNITSFRWSLFSLMLIREMSEFAWYPILNRLYCCDRYVLKHDMYFWCALNHKSFSP